MKLNLFILFTVLLMFSCQPAAVNKSEAISNDQKIKTDLEWLASAVIYEVNIRQYTPEGTINAFAKHMDRLDSMGIDILWLMPIHPISESKRKGTLGSYYAVNDYKKIHPDYGTEQDLRKLIQEAHNRDMKVILDWVANHTGWDNHWISEHPEWYTRDEEGKITDPLNPETGESYNWSDVADLNFDVPEMRKAMIEAMSYWVKEFDIDGFRCDVAWAIPTDFWADAVKSLNKIKPLFMLAESELPELRNKEIFHATYSWKLMHLMNSIGKKEAVASDIIAYYQNDTADFSSGFHMLFTTNHDENSWAGTVFERYGDGHLTFAALTNTLSGMPLLYSGQEEPLRHRLEFFEKDLIPFNQYNYRDFYTILFQLKEDNPALWTGEAGGLTHFLETESEHILAFLRIKDSARVLTILNLHDQAHSTRLSVDNPDQFKEVFTGDWLQFSDDGTIALDPWEYRIYETH